MAINTKKFKGTSKEHLFQDGNRVVQVILNRQSDGTTTIVDVTMNVTGGGLKKQRTKTDSVFIRDKSADKIKTTIRFGRLDGYSKYMISIEFSVKTLEISKIYVMKE